MGATGYYGLTAEQAKAEEVRGFDVVKKAGNWWLCVPQTPIPDRPALLFYFKTERYGDEISVKTMSIDEGPYGAAPSKPIAELFVAYYGGDVDKAGGHYGAPILKEVLASTPVKLKKGQRFVVTGSGRNYPFGTADRTYTYLGGYTALTDDGLRVRLWKTFRANISEVLPD